MKRRILAIIFIFIFVFVQVGDCYARSRSGGSKSHRSSSSRSTKYFGGSSSSNKSSGYSGGSSKSSGSSSSSSSGKTSNSGKTTSSSKSSASKSKNVQDAYKAQASKNNYNAYKAKLNSEQQKVYDSSMKRNYNLGNKMNLDDAMRTRPSRIRTYSSRPIFVNINTGYFGSPFSYGYASVGPWDLWFLLRASELFWYHHWHDIYAYRNYFEAAQFAQMEARVRALEAQNVVRDTNYLDPDVEPDLQFSSEYQEKNASNIYYSNRSAKRAGNPIVTIIIILIIAVVIIIIIKKVSRPKRSQASNSRIY